MDTKHAAPTAAAAAATPAVHVVATPLAGGDPIAPHWQPVKIAKFLYLGSYKNATDIATIKKLGITGIICCAPEHMQVVKDFGRHTLTKERKARSAAINMDYLFLHWDAKRPPVHTVFEDVNRALHFIEQQAARGGKVLIHCHLGTDRAAAVAIAFIMRKCDLTYDDALAHLRSLPGAVVHPSEWIADTLVCFE